MLSPAKVERACQVCGKRYVRFRSMDAKNRRCFCSQKCYHSVRQSRGYIPWRQGQRRARAVVADYFPLQSVHVVHHWDGDNRNNDVTNLAVFRNQSEHMACHHGSEVKPLWDGRNPQLNMDFASGGSCARGRQIVADTTLRRALDEKGDGSQIHSVLAVPVPAGNQSGPLASSSQCSAEKQAAVGD